MTESQLSSTFLDIPDVTLHLYGAVSGSICGAKDMSGTMRVFEQTPSDKRCEVYQEHYLRLPAEEIERQRNRFLAT